MKPWPIMYMFSLLTFSASAVFGAGHPVSNDAFRSDTTLGFMGKIEVPHLSAEPEAARSQLCTFHGFKATERAGCVANMRQRCYVGQTLSKDVSCVHFFQQAQPGYERGTQMHEQESKDEAEEPLSDSGWPSLQKGPNYDSKKAQKKADQVADGQKDAPKHTSGWPKPLKKFGEAIEDAGEAFSDAMNHKGHDFTNADFGGKEKKEEPKVEKRQTEAEEQPEPEQSVQAPSGLGGPDDGPEDKEVASVPGCKNSPKGWADSKGNDCEDYAEGEWCNRRGGYGDAWLDEWGTFEDLATKGITAVEVCCVCGGGFKEPDAAEAPGAAGPSAAPSASPAGAPVGSPAAAPGGAPAGGPAAAPSAVILGGKKVPGSLQSQGYSGEWVMHEDGETMTSDWGREFGPSAGHRDAKTICAEHPGNEWCDLHGYYDKQRVAAPKSNGDIPPNVLMACGVLLVALLIACGYMRS